MPRDNKNKVKDDERKYCKVCGRKLDRIYKHNMCQKHYDQWIEFGTVLDDNPRYDTDPNEVIKGNTYASIVLYDNFQEDNGERIIIDTEDVDKIKEHVWTKKQTCVINENKELLVNVLMDTTDRVEIINGDMLDCRKENLRVVEKKEKKKKKNPYIVSKKNRNKIIVEFIGDSQNEVTGTSILVSYPTKEDNYESILIEMGMVQRGNLKEEYVINKGVMERMSDVAGSLIGCLVSHPHL